MAELNVVRGEVVTDMTVDEARAITDRIKSTAEEMWSLLLMAHERKAWAPLGYRTWEEYVRGEFNMSRSRSYQLLDQANTIRQIEAAAPVSTSVDITEAEVRDIKPVLPQVTQQIRERVADLGPAPQPQQVKEVVRDVVQETRTTMRQQQSTRRPGPRLTNISRAVSTALAEIDRARRELVRLAPQVAQQDEEARRMWAANLSEQLEALTSFRDNL